MLSNNIALKIEESIRSKAYLTGEQLPTEAEFCQQFGASRTAVREALKGLQSRGLVQIRKGSGVYVAKLSSIDATNPLDLYFEMSEDKDLIIKSLKVRQLFEPEIASLAALNRSDEHLRGMEENLSQLRNCTIGDIKSETHLDMQFHSIITDATENNVLSIIMRPIHNLSFKHRKLVFGKSEKLDPREMRDAVINYHHKIFDAIKNGDSREAYYQMKEHLHNTEKSLKEINQQLNSN